MKNSQNHLILGVFMKSAGDFNTNAPPCRIGGANFLVFKIKCNLFLYQ